MSRSSAFARVIGLTRTLSPFDKAQPGEVPEDIAAAGSLVAMPLPEGSAAPAEGGDGGPKALPALAQVTVVAGAAQSVAGIDSTRQAVTDQAIEAIEADIASLLSSLDATSDMPPQRVSDDEDEAPAEADDGEEPTLVLLSELDRLWRADPVIAASPPR